MASEIIRSSDYMIATFCSVENSEPSLLFEKDKIMAMSQLIKSLPRLAKHCESFSLVQVLKFNQCNLPATTSFIKSLTYF